MKQILFISDGMIVGKFFAENAESCNFDGIYNDIQDDMSDSFKVGQAYDVTVNREFVKKYNASLPEIIIPPEQSYKKPDEKPAQCTANIVTYGNIWTREIEFKKAGEVKNGHKHEFDHLHFVSHGSVQITVFDEFKRDKVIFQKDYTAPAWIKVPKEHFHDIIALEDNSRGYCIQSLLTDNANVIETDYAKDDDWIKEVNNFELSHGLEDETLK